MKTLIRVAVILFFVSTPLFAQISPRATSSGTRRASATKEMMPSAEEMFRSLSGDGEKKFSIKDTIMDLMSAGTAEPIANTEESVSSAIEENAKLVIEEETSAINQEAAQPVDTKTKRYAPRLTIDFKQFPLRRVPRTATATIVPVRIGDRLRARLREDGIQIDFNENVVRLHGVVSSAEQRELAEMMLRFEPGIDRIQNDLVVQP